jgi:hypothetical protein
VFFFLERFLNQIVHLLQLNFFGIQQFIDVHFHSGLAGKTFFIGRLTKRLVNAPIVFESSGISDNLNALIF